MLGQTIAHYKDHGLLRRQQASHSRYARGGNWRHTVTMGYRFSVVDGMNLVPLLHGESALDREALYWHYPHYSNQGGFPGDGICMGRYKLVERYEDGQVHFYDLGERHDMASENDARVSEVRKRLHAWCRDVGAKFLSAKPNGPAPWQPY